MRPPAVPAPPQTSRGVPGGGAPQQVVRSLVVELLGQERLTLPEASQIEAALRRLDWSVVWDLLAMGQARCAAGQARSAAPPPAQPRPAQALSDATGGAAQVRGLLSLVFELCDGLVRLAGHEDAFVARITALRALLAGRLTPECIDDVRSRLGQLIEEQLQVQRGLQETRSSLKHTLATVLERLAAVGESTRHFRQRVTVYQADLAADPAPETLQRVASGLLVDTRRLAEEICQSHQQLDEARLRVESFELRVRDLEHELAQTTRMARNDPLTHALNRRGLDEIVRTEAARSTRYQVPLTLTMIDLDDFKRINDQMGHAGGDRALVHFVTTASANLRSTDRIARTGGEEFVLIFPATGIAAALDAVRRLQSALAQSPIPGEGQRWLLTFSAGTAQWREGDSLDQILARADAALYQAKQLGKNRVEAAP